MRKIGKRRLIAWVAGGALLLSVFVGVAGDASAAGGGTVQTYDGIVWCRTC
jgi:hypothetical protein